ncbi:hypothetical protein CU097_009311, partial [Rhizopus azygosporus]
MVGCSLLKQFSRSFKRSNSLSSSTATIVGSTHKVDYSTTSKEALDFLDFLNASPSPFHAVHEASARLEKAGFQKISEKHEWHLKKKGKYYFTRNGSSLVAFVIGGEYHVDK